MEKKKEELLKALMARLEEDDDIERCAFFKAADLEAPMDTLRAMIKEFGSELTDVLGEFFFLPLPEESTGEDLWFFSTVITISESLPTESVEELAAAIARLNYLLPCGCFALGQNDRTLVYRLSVPVEAKDKKDRQMKSIDAAVNSAFGVADRFTGYLVLIAEGNMGCNEFLRTLGIDAQ